MDKDEFRVDFPSDSDPIKAVETAELVRRDFSALLQVFDHQLANAAANGDERRSQISQARAAAERGLNLSTRLIEILRTLD